MSAAQELFDLLKDARPSGRRRDEKGGADPYKTSAPARVAISCKPALKAVRFTVELPEFGGAVELSPRRGFSPVHCKHCGLERKSEKTNKVVHWWRPMPCNCGGLR